MIAYLENLSVTPRELNLTVTIYSISVSVLQ